MLEEGDRTVIQVAWIKFVKSVEPLLVPQPEDRPLDQYLLFRDAVLGIVQSDKFLNELNKAWDSLAADLKPIGEILLLELQAFPRAMEVAQRTEKPEEPKKKWFMPWLGRAGTVSDSLKDLAGNNPYVKAALTIFKESIDLFREKG